MQRKTVVHLYGKVLYTAMGSCSCSSHTRYIMACCCRKNNTLMTWALCFYHYIFLCCAHHIHYICVRTLTTVMSSSLSVLTLFLYLHLHNITTSVIYCSGLNKIKYQIACCFVHFSQIYFHVQNVYKTIYVAPTNHKIMYI